MTHFPIAPAHLRGPMPARVVPQERRTTRDRWAADRANEGQAYTDIGHALEISARSARAAALRGGHVPKGTGEIRPSAFGLRYGSLTPLFRALPREDQERLLDLAIARKTTIAEALLRHYLEGAQA